MVAQTCFTDLIIYDHQDVADPTQKLLALFQLLKRIVGLFLGVLQGIANHLFPKNLPKLWCSSDSRSKPCYVCDDFGFPVASQTVPSLVHPWRLGHQPTSGPPQGGTILDHRFRARLKGSDSWILTVFLFEAVVFFRCFWVFRMCFARCCWGRFIKKEHVDFY